MNFIIPTPELSRKDFLQSLTNHFPAIAEEVLGEDYTGLIHLQVACLARYANRLIATARLDELERVFRFFHDTVERVDSDTENALYVSFLEHIDMDGESSLEKEARKLLQPHYLPIWLGLRK